MAYLFFFLSLVYLIIWPAWYFTKLARWGKGFFCPDFDEMNEKVYIFKRNYYKGFFSYNRMGGKIKYYCYLLYFMLFVSSFLFLILGFIYAYFKVTYFTD